MSTARKPNEIARLTGAMDKNPQRYRDRKDVKFETSLEITKPNFKYKKTSDAWDSMIPQFLNFGLVSVADITLLYQMFDGIDEYFHLMRLADSFKRKYTEAELLAEPKLLDGLVKINKQKISVLDSWSKISYRFGVTPVERTKISIQKSETKDEIDEILEG